LVEGPVKPIVERGYIAVPEGPGLGVTLNEEVCRQHLKPGTEWFAPTPQWNEAQSWDDAIFS
ncbi:MAG TPA: mandelate racemase/muconate lactonizing enzyme family protein, partial [Chloroflexota bacterium]|nr:mandelate racemase/muconate lactonizing enzyme family protein [Chloroflexota bacterium]